MVSGVVPHELQVVADGPLAIVVELQAFVGGSLAVILAVADG